MTTMIMQTAMTRQPADRHDGNTSHYPRPPGEGWLFVGLSYDASTCHYAWSRTRDVPRDLLTSVEAMDADGTGETTTLRQDARYLRGLAALGPAEWCADDARRLGGIAARLDAVADMLLPEEGA